MNNSSDFENVYEAITHQVRVSVRPSYLDDQSDPDNNRYFWAYEVEVSNESALTIQLCARTWHITDGQGRNERVGGPGVVGEQPILNPGDLFRYTSGCPLTTPSGFMVGSYTMAYDNGNKFEVDIPAFALDLPDAGNIVN